MRHDDSVRLGCEHEAIQDFARPDTQGSPRHHPHPTHSGEAHNEVAEMTWNVGFAIKSEVANPREIFQ
jgi:hypothetical protein